ncbi:hypothetical protein QJS04_geneDACA015213 [Acorus gramineus]|uniref:Uncharacterized protein n=1 Tax=Acorus gramineus TaxID=55184 RepID=A0AAV9BDA1_ACOGR|nr:hypothetical protein QJS04_geneDACA015213 [Acorus gramineus]
MESAPPAVVTLEVPPANVVESTPSMVPPPRMPPIILIVVVSPVRLSVPSVQVLGVSLPATVAADVLRLAPMEVPSATATRASNSGVPTAMASASIPSGGPLDGRVNKELACAQLWGCLLDVDLENARRATTEVIFTWLGWSIYNVRNLISSLKFLFLYPDIFLFRTFVLLQVLNERSLDARRFEDLLKTAQELAYRREA